MNSVNVHALPGKDAGSGSDRAAQEFPRAGQHSQGAGGCLQVGLGPAWAAPRLSRLSPNALTVPLVAHRSLRRLALQLLCSLEAKNSFVEMSWDGLTSLPTLCGTLHPHFESFLIFFYLILHDLESSATFSRKSLLLPLHASWNC